MTLTDVPAELRDADQWVLWKSEGAKGTKVPYQVDAPTRRASSMDPAQWGTFAAAVGRDIPGMGIGYVFNGTGFTGIDLDACRDPETGVIESWATAIIQNLDSYTEVSPSLTGVKIWVRGTAPANTKRNVYTDRPNKGKARAIEMYDRGRYFTVTGDHVSGTPLAVNDAQDALNELYDFYWPKADGEMAMPAMAPTPNNVADDDLLEIMFRSRNGEAIRALYLNGDTANYAGDDSSADIALCNHLAFYTGNDAARIDRLFRNSALMRGKWDSKRGPSTWGAVTVANAIAHTRNVYVPGVATIGRIGASPTPSTPFVDRETGELLTGPQPIDWPTFFATDHTQEDWLVEPFLPRGRSIVLFGGAKAGKSLLGLDVAARLATGQAVFDTPAGAPQHVVYLDYEQSEADLFERLQSLGYGPETDFSHFHYYLLPAMRPLDSPQGGAELLAIVRRWDTQLVVIDTVSRVISQGENDADTIRAFYLFSLLPVKALGVTILRLDHSGKAPEQGQRGSSAKADDCDLVWQMVVKGEGVELTATHRRQGWVPSDLCFERVEDPVLEHRQTARLWRAEALTMAKAVDDLGLPLDVHTRTAAAALRGSGVKVRNGVISEALRYRRHAAVPETVKAEGRVHASVIPVIASVREVCRECAREFDTQHMQFGLCAGCQ